MVLRGGGSGSLRPPLTQAVRTQLAKGAAMEKFMMKLKWKIRKWLGLGETFIGVDMAASRRDQSCVVVVSRLNNGSVRIIDCQFENVQEMNRLVRDLQQRYGVSSRETFADMPPGMRREF